MQDENDDGEQQPSGKKKLNAARMNYHHQLCIYVFRSDGSCDMPPSNLTRGRGHRGKEECRPNSEQRRMNHLVPSSRKTLHPIGRKAGASERNLFRLSAGVWGLLHQEEPIR